MFLWVVMADQVLYMWMQVIIWMMSIHWRERDWACLREAVRDEEPSGSWTLAACGLLKFFECSLVRAQEYLLQFLIRCGVWICSVSLCGVSSWHSLWWRMYIF
jgi:hypothetical protein